MADAPEKLDLRSGDVAEDRRQELLRLFPEVRTEGGNLDFERLKLALGETVDLGRERYGLTWPGKADCLRTIQAPSLATLRPRPEESIDFDTTQNVIIEGDNLEVLKLLQKPYLGKVKLIYIDPPYNTGKEFIYPDNYSESLQTYLEYTGQVDAEGRKFSTNTDADGRFHSKWLSMMYPRLYLARNLLAEDGVIFISIDDNEIANLRKLCEELFGEDGFVATCIWQKRYSRENRGAIGDAHDYVVVVARNAEAFKASRGLLALTEEQARVYRNPNNDPKGEWRVVPMTAQGYRPNQMYKIQLPEPTGRTDYPTIAEITKERVRRSIAALNEADQGALALEGIPKQDRGFRVFRLAESNFKPWPAEGAEDADALARQMELHINNVVAGRSDADVLHEILLKSGYPLTVAVEKLTLAGKTVYSVAGGVLLVCLDRPLTLEALRAMAARKPERVVCLDSAFAGDDPLKANAVQIFKSQGVTTFKTV